MKTITVNTTSGMIVVPMDKVVYAELKSYSLDQNDEGHVTSFVELKLFNNEVITAYKGQSASRAKQVYSEIIDVLHSNPFDFPVEPSTYDE